MLAAETLEFFISSFWQRKIASNSRAVKSALPLYEKYCFFKVSRMQTEL
jgi:hypothetical protein